MTTENISNTTVPSVPKMSIARDIFNEAQSNEAPRKTFIAQVQLSVEEGGAGLSKSGASTYYQNLKREKEGGKLYQTSGKSATDRAETNAVESITIE